MEQNTIKSKQKQETSNKAISFNNLQDNLGFAQSMNDIEVVYSTPTDEVIEMDYVYPVSDQTT